jgi:CRP-like cAMP-binding protein
VSSPPLPGRLSADFLHALTGIKSVHRFAPGATLFQQGSPVSGVYLVESGDVRVLLSTGHNQMQLLEVVGTGAVLGLSENITGESYRTTAEASVETTAAFIAREDFLVFLREHCDFSLQVVRLLSDELHGLYAKFRSISAHPGRPRQRDLDEELN